MTMAESLIIQMRDGVAPQWMVCNDDGHVAVNAMSGELAQALPLAVGRRVAVIVPGTEVLTTETEAPAKNAAKLAQVIPYALEERVADEIEDLHFAIGERNAETGRVPVVVVARARIDAWLSTLRAAGFSPQAIYSEASLLPAMPGQLIALLDGDSLTLRLAEGPPLVLPALSITDGFEMALAGQASPVAGLEPAPPGLLLYSGHDEWQAHQNEVDALRERFTGVKVQLLPSGPLSVLAPAAAGGEAVNLLQGASRWLHRCSRAGNPGGWPRCLPPRCCACTWAHAISSSRACKKSEAALDVSIQDAFRIAMPGQQNSTNARRRVEARLDRGTRRRRRWRAAAGTVRTGQCAGGGPGRHHRRPDVP